MTSSMTLNRLKNDNYVIIVSMKSEPTSNTRFASFDIKFNFISKDTHLVFSIYHSHISECSLLTDVHVQCEIFTVYGHTY